MKANSLFHKEQQETALARHPVSQQHATVPFRMYTHDLL